MSNNIKVVHVITGLELAGAEMMLYKLLASMNESVVNSEVISLTEIGFFGKKIEALGVPVRALGMSRSLPNPFCLLKLANWLRKSKPDVVQTWMYHADLIGGLAAKLHLKAPVVWGVHHYNLDLKYNKNTTVFIAKICAKLSKFLPTKIVCCSDAARQVHDDLGYISEKLVVISNGIDTSVFKPEPSSRIFIRKELGIPDEALLIGMIARFDLQKDHQNFINAAALLRREYPDIHFLLCGNGITWNNKKLVKWINDAGVRESFHLLGIRTDVEQVTAALDVATLSSIGESFSLMIGEAMASGIPCVTTEIPASVELLGGYGWVVPIHDSLALSQAWQEILKAEGVAFEKRLDAARERIHNEFSLEAMVKRYEHLFESLFLHS